MLFYVFYCSVFFLAILAAKTDLKENNSTDNSDAIFADVIKNISRVNNVLQELINNYEQLQKIYKSQENFSGPEYSSETDSERYLNDNKNSKREKKRSFNNYLPSSKAKKNDEPATQMIFLESNDNEEDVETKTTKRKENALKTERSVKVERLQVDNKQSAVVKTTTKKKDEYSDESSSSEESKDLSIVASTTAKPTVTSKLKPTSSPKAGINTAEIFVEAHKQGQQQKKSKIMPGIPLNKSGGSRKSKTRHNLKEMTESKVKDVSYGTKKEPGHLLYGLYNVSSSTSSVSYLHVDFLPTSIGWSHDPVPKKLKQLILSSRGADGKQIEAKLPVSLRSRTNITKTTKVFEPKNKDDIPGDNLDTTSQMTDDDAAITKDVFKTSVLRQAYGDACLKLVVRKCYKACKGALSSSCRSTKCKSDIKEFFDRSVRTYCIQAFNASTESNVYEGLRDNGFMKGAPLVDMTRAGYLSVACVAEQETGMPIPIEKETSSQKPEEKEIKLNILRDRYEKACQRTSQAKCDRACNNAQNATCFKFECSKQLKKNFRRNCKTHCKNAYTYKKSKSSGSSSSGSTSSGSSESTSSS